MIKKFKEWFVAPRWEIGKSVIKDNTISPSVRKGQSKFKKEIINPLVLFYTLNWKWIWTTLVGIAIALFFV